MTNNQPTTISISGQTNRDLCPVLALYIYLTTFNPKMGPFFQFQDGSPVKHGDIQIFNASINLSKISFVMGKRVSVLPANLLQPFNND
jgi:hypothetical protein